MTLDLLTANDTQGAYPASYYAATAPQLPPFATAKGAITCDVCVVGGGYTGLSAALHLAEKGYDVVLLEAQRVGFGASGRNGGQVATGQRVEMDSVEKMVGMGPAKALWDLSLDSVQLVKDLIKQHDMDVPFHDGVIEAAHRARFVPDYHAYAAHLERVYGYTQVTTLDRNAMHDHVGSPAYHGGTLDMGSGHIHPLRYALGLARAAQSAGVRIFENSKVNNLSRGTPAKITTEHADISASYVVLGCNGYLGALDGKVAKKVMPINNFIAATEPLDDHTAKNLIRYNHAVADSKFVINYFRLSDDNRMLFGGGESYGYRFPKDIAATVRKPMSEIFPQLKNVKIDYAWGGTLGITMNRMPHFARLAGNVLTASGYSGHGVAMATLSGKLAADAIAGQAEKFDLMASVPTTAFPGGSRLRAPLLAAAMIYYSLRDRL
ncbi:FAD-binding oxidoreductase [Loktanella sp. F6476L]|uniref:NAD(P)/FAD-dependent oxidoreductase n=1 Tax=Loktanella sp. F6476L TaxID=2926405 RepID=UPI001FF54203|nr:FAD-binding oxidoreductase [Loktanella sp. F6476L]